MIRPVHRFCLAFIACFALARAAAAEAVMKAGDYVAIVGDSITEQRLYSLFMEEYLLMCQPVPRLQATQFGWSGETSWGFAARMANDMLRFQPTVATTCFGMNDGGYSPMTPEKIKRYRDGQTAIVQGFKKAGIRTIVVGSPGCVDADAFRNDPNAAIMYNTTLTEERDIAREVAQSEGVLFADVITPMIATMTKAKVKYGKGYHLAGADGIHPDQNGQLVMAYAFLKALGCDGDLGRIAVDLAAGKAEAAGGHKVLSCEGGTVELESARYPFCFFGDPAKPGSTRGVIEFFPFNEDLNRLTLVVEGVPPSGADVSWGKDTRHFTAEQLKQGINLAAEFLDNPFLEPFQKVEAQIRKQQEFETLLVKNLIHSTPEYKRMIPDESAALDKIVDSGIRRDKSLIAESSTAVAPVRHKLVIAATR